jgi:hypothetical protein
MDEQRRYPPGAILPSDPLWALGQPEGPPPPKLRKDGKPYRRDKRTPRQRKTKRADPEMRAKARTMWREALEREERWVARAAAIEEAKVAAVTAMWDAGMTLFEVRDACGAHIETVLRWRKGYNGKTPWPRMVLYELRQARGRRPEGAGTAREIRAWARSQGMDVAPKGQLPDEVIAAHARAAAKQNGA